MCVFRTKHERRIGTCNVQIWHNDTWNVQEARTTQLLSHTKKEDVNIILGDRSDKWQGRNSKCVGHFALRGVRNEKYLHKIGKGEV